MFYGRTINKQPIPVNKRIYVLEDIDAASLEDVVKRRDEATNGEEIDTKVEEKMAPGETSPKKEEGEVFPKKEAKPKLTLADLLEVFDGVMEMRVEDQNIKFHNLQKR